MLRRFSCSRFLYEGSSRRQFSLRRPTLLRLAFFSLAAALALATLWSGVSPAFAQKKRPQPAAEKARAAGDVARGKYIVEDVAVCSQCHTPRDSNGNLDHTRWLQGGPVPYQPSRPDSDWPVKEPRIGGTLPADDPAMIKLLTTGIWTDGNHLRLPMPQFRMNRSDAEAVVAYLKTVNPQP